MRVLRLGLLMGLVFLAAACTDPDNDSREPTPTVPLPTATVTLTVTASPSPSPTRSGLPSATFPPTLTPSHTPSPQPPTGSPTPTETPGPLTDTVREGDDCFGIILRNGHPDAVAVIQEFYRLNGMTSCALRVGQTVLVPRPTSVAPGISTNLNVTPHITPASGAFWSPATICAVEGDTLTSLALKAGTTNKEMCELNPPPNGINCSGCDFSQSDVGSCPRPPVIGEGQCLIIVGPTPTLMPTPTPSGSETPTPTPTLRAPEVVNPRNGATISGVVRLHWVSIGVLAENQYYVVHVRNETAGTDFFQQTQATSVEIPADFFASSGQPQNVVWYVSIEALDSGGLLIPIGGRTADYRFTWQ